MLYENTHPKPPVSSDTTTFFEVQFTFLWKRESIVHYFHHLYYFHISSLILLQNPSLSLLCKSENLICQTFSFHSSIYKEGILNAEGENLHSWKDCHTWSSPKPTPPLPHFSYANSIYNYVSQKPSRVILLFSPFLHSTCSTSGNSVGSTF